MFNSFGHAKEHCKNKKKQKNKKNGEPDTRTKT